MRPRPHTTTPPIVIPSPILPWLRAIGRMADEHGIAAYAVGGCVRDWLLGKARTTDLDVTVESDGVTFAGLLAKALGVDATFHPQFGTATLLIARERATPPSPQRRTRATPSHAPSPIRIDVASCRKERYTEPAAYPTVTAGRLRDDLFRRDFTINAMAMAINGDRFGDVVDLFEGLKDLKARRLRILHAKSFVDDPSRILRAARFVPRYRLSLEANTAKALRQAIAGGFLARLNRGRLRKELEHMLEEPDPVACLAQLGRWLDA